MEAMKAICCVECGSGTAMDDYDPAWVMGRIGRLNSAPLTLRIEGETVDYPARSVLLTSADASTVGDVRTWRFKIAAYDQPVGWMYKAYEPAVLAFLETLKFRKRAWSTSVDLDHRHTKAWMFLTDQAGQTAHAQLGI